MSTQQQLFSIIASLVGQRNIPTIPRVFIDLTEGHLHAALLLSQCIYWSDKGSDNEFYKTDADWREELGFTDYRLRKAKQALTEKNLITITIKQANGSPTSHYHISQETITNAITRFVDGQRNDLLTVNETICRPSTNGIVDGQRMHSSTVNDSITETTQETTTETTAVSPAANAAGERRTASSTKPPAPVQASPTKKTAASRTSKKVAKPAKPAGPPKPPYWGDLVAETITAFAVPRGVGAKLAEQLAGVAAKGERAAHNCEPAAQVGDVTAFVKWFKREHDGIDLPTSAEALALWWHRYHAAAVKRAETVYANGMTQAEVDARWAEMQAEMQGRERSQDEQEAYDYAMYLLEVA